MPFSASWIGHVHHRVHARFLRPVATEEARGDRGIGGIGVPIDNGIRLGSARPVPTWRTGTARERRKFAYSWFLLL